MLDSSPVDESLFPLKVKDVVHKILAAKENITKELDLTRTQNESDRITLCQTFPPKGIEGKICSKESCRKRHLTGVGI